MVPHDFLGEVVGIEVLHVMNSEEKQYTLPHVSSKEDVFENKAAQSVV